MKLCVISNEVYNPYFAYSDIKKMYLYIIKTYSAKFMYNLIVVLAAFIPAKKPVIFIPMPKQMFKLLFDQHNIHPDYKYIRKHIKQMYKLVAILLRINLSFFKKEIKKDHYCIQFKVSKKQIFKITTKRISIALPIYSRLKETDINYMSEYFYYFSS